MRIGPRRLVTMLILDVVTSNGNYYFRWEMTIHFKDSSTFQPWAGCSAA